MCYIDNVRVNKPRHRWTVGRRPQEETMQLLPAHTGSSGEMRRLLPVRGRNRRDNNNKGKVLVLFNEVLRTNSVRVEMVSADWRLDRSRK